MYVEIVCALAIVCVLLLVKSGHGNKNLPPGPWGLPIVGHLFFMGKKPYLTWIEWKKKYGPIVSFKFGSFPAIILNDAKLIKQAYNMPEFSGKIQFAEFSQSSKNKGILSSEGFHNTEQRHFALRNMRDFGVGGKEIGTKFQEGVSELVSFIKERDGLPIKNSEIPSQHIITTLWSILMTEPLDTATFNEFAYLFGTKIISLGGILTQLAFFMPWIETAARVLTFGQFSIIKDRVAVLTEVYDFMGKQIEERKKTWVKGNPRDISDNYLDKVEETTEAHSSFHSSQSYQKYFIGDLFAGGFDTTATTLQWLFFYMAKCPSAQKKLQDELDSVVGNSRLPSLTDRSQLPYTEAVFYEVSRIASVAVTGPPHRTTKDVLFHNYLIPKNTMVLANIYGVHHNQEVYPEPDSFKPERWLTIGAKTLKSDHFLPFLTGKRACVGESIARAQLFLYSAIIFHQFSVKFADGCQGEGESPIGIVLKPPEYSVVFSSRK